MSWSRQRAFQSASKIFRNCSSASWRPAFRSLLSHSSALWTALPKVRFAELKSRGRRSRYWKRYLREQVRYRLIWLTLIASGGTIAGFLLVGHHLLDELTGGGL